MWKEGVRIYDISEVHNNFPKKGMKTQRRLGP